MNIIEDQNIGSFTDSEFITGIVVAITLGILIWFYNDLCNFWKTKLEKADVMVSLNQCFSQRELEPSENDIQQSKAIQEIKEFETNQEEKSAVMEEREVCVEAEQIINEEVSSDC